MKLASAEKIADYRKRGWWGDVTYYDAFSEAVRAKGDAVAAIDPPDREALYGGAPRRASWNELADETERTAAALVKLGVKKADRVILQMPNVVDAIPVFMACAKLGVILSPLPVQYSGHEIRHAVATTDAVMIIAAARFKDRALAAEAKKMVEGRISVLSMGPDSVEGIESLQSLAEKASLKKGPFGLGGQAAPRAGEADDCFTICWTSGTTGTPKGVPRSHNHWMAIVPASYAAMQLQEGDVFLNPFPMTNMAAISGMMGNWLVAKGVLVLHHPFDPKIFLGQLVSEGVTATIAPPAVLTMLLKDQTVLNALDLSKLRVVGSGSAPLSEFMVAGWKERGVEIVNIFGSNEGVSLATGPLEAPDPARRASSFPWFGHKDANFSNPLHEKMDTRLVNLETGEDVTVPGVSGEFRIKGPAVFEGYWQSDAAEYADVFDDQGFFRTGDLFEISPDDPHFLVFKGRSKDIIIRGGVNISAAEIDTLLEGHPKLAEAAVFSVEDDVMGERIHVAVVPRPGETVTLSDITEFLTAKELAKFKMPERAVQVQALPRNAMNKVLRWQLRDLAKETVS